MTNKIFTISREYCSGGRTVGEMLAKKLGIPLYDKEFVDAMAQECGFSHEFIEEIGEYATVTNSFLFSIAVSTHMDGSTNMITAADRLYACQANYIQELAEKGPCVIVGRCADYILRDDPNAVHAFLYADFKQRISHMNANGLSEKEAAKLLKEKDGRRRVYYKHYTGRNWGEPQNYDICLNTARLGLEKTTDILASMA
ncbi:MAG: cytidylate kinase-like family protein [Oscillospiraceae bacterium]|nr:cytidylate kinase-like family protein [Oscillospiraceae bacterium]